MTDVHEPVVPGAHRAHRVRRVLVNVLLWPLLVVALWFVWPVQLGGCTTLTIVSGHSMEPTFYTGDLVVSRCADPAVGDVVVYATPETQGGRVIHRIVGGDSSGWVLRGDNNPADDPFHPTDEQVLGSAVLHVPRVGTVLTSLANPVVWLSCVLIAAAFFLWPDKDPRGPAEAEGPRDDTADDDTADDDLADDAPVDGSYGDVPVEAGLTQLDDDKALL